MIRAAVMPPVPGVNRDTPDMSRDDADSVDNEDIPAFIIPEDNTSDSDDDQDDVYGGYQLLPQDPDGHSIHSGTSGSALTPGGDVGTPGLDDVIMSALDAGDCQPTSTYEQVERRSTTGCAARVVSTSSEPPQRKRIAVEPMNPDQAEKVISAMKGFVLPSANMPHWANVIPEEQWKSRLLAGMPPGSEPKAGPCHQTDNVLDKT